MKKKALLITEDIGLKVAEEAKAESFIAEILERIRVDNPYLADFVNAALLASPNPGRELRLMTVLYRLFEYASEDSRNSNLILPYSQN